MAIVPIGIFVRNTFGEKGFDRWTEALSPAARKVFCSEILPGAWYPMKETMSEPVRKMCDLFYGGNVKGSWESGRFVAEHGLKGIYEMFVKGGNLEAFVEKGGLIIAAYYRPPLDVHIETKKGSGTMRINNPPADLDDILEANIAGWVERAMEIIGCEDVKLLVTKSVARHDPLIEFQAYWK